jgi:hypothetical protein
MHLDRASALAWLVAATFLFLPFGSTQDRVLLITAWILTRIPSVQSILKRFQVRLGIETVHCVLLNLACITWAWGNARFRAGGGPFHIVDAGLWRGYPFMFESWVWGDAGLITVWRDVQWLGLAADAFILIAACIAITKHWYPLRAPVFPIFLGLASATFVWLNMEPWVFGAPLTVVGPPPTASPEQMRNFVSKLTFGFPWAVADLNSTGLRTWPLVGNAALGFISWGILFAFSRVNCKARTRSLTRACRPTG